jgi:hypothetical protein
MTEEIHNSHGEPLDGTGDIQPTDFDAHEQSVRGEHKPTSATSPDLDPKKVKQYPKAVDHDDKGEPVLVNSAEEEKAYNAKKAPAKPAEVK